MRSPLVAAWPFLVLIALAALFTLMLVFSRKAPAIASLTPPLAAPGEQVVVTGEYFGRTEREGTLSLAGEIPPPSLIQSWTDQKIVFVVPEDATSGLVTVSNSQGTSPGVLFTNTQSIPTVLQSAAAPGEPLATSVVPSAPVAGQSVTVAGRGFGWGEEPSSVLVTLAPEGPRLEVVASRTLAWTDRAVTFRMPAGATAATTVQVRTPRGSTPLLPVPTLGPLTFTEPLTITVDVRAAIDAPGLPAMTVRGPIPQRDSGTGWTLVSSDPAPVAATLGPVYRWAAGGSARKLAYRLALTSWTRSWSGPPSGPMPADAPAADAGLRDRWKAAQAALKTLTAKWGLDTPDPWQRLLRIQNGLGVFRMAAGAAEQPVLVREPAAILSSGTLNAYEASSLAAALAIGAGVPARQVSGLYLDGDALTTRFWLEVWVAGAGWVPWDPLLGPPGSLDNRHFLFETTRTAPVRWETRSRSVGPAVPAGLGTPSGEATENGQEPIVRWEITRVSK